MMRFDIEKFAEEFKQTIDWMLKDKYGDELKYQIQRIEDNKIKLAKNPCYPDALGLIVQIIIRQAFYYNKPPDFDSEMKTFLKRNKASFRSGQEDLMILVEKLAPPRIKERAKKSVRQLLTNYSTIKDFTEKLYALSKQGKKDILGEKGRDIYLRDFGYLDRIPIDRHEMRFIIRTGIYHANSVRQKSDPLGKSSLHEAQSQFCSKYLRGKTVEGIDLGTAPGLVDIFIWTHCAKEKYDICGSNPKCNECKLKGKCLYAVTNQL